MIQAFFNKLVNLRTALFITLAGLMGGTSQSIYYPKVILYIIATLLIAWVIKQKTIKGIYQAAPFIITLLIVYVLYIAIQFIALPSGLWVHLPGKENVVEAYSVMEVNLPYLPIGMSPSSVMPSLLSVLPPLAVFLLIVCVASQDEQRLAFWSVPFVGFLSLLLGALQVQTESQVFDLYAVRNEDSAIGVFSNVNHNATLIAISLCFVLIFAIKFFTDRKTLYSANKISELSLFFLTLFFTAGLFLNGSVAGYLLMPVIFAGALLMLFWDTKARSTKAFFIVPILIALFVIDIWVFGNIKNSLLASLDSSTTSRPEIYANGFQMAKDFFPFGSGLGSFSQIYPMYEDVITLKSLYVPHAHNDYMEFIIEMGFVGLCLIAAFMFWFFRKMYLILMSADIDNEKEYILAALLGAICIMMHSLVDYPVRTITISVVFALCLGYVQISRPSRSRSV